MSVIRYHEEGVVGVVESAPTCRTVEIREYVRVGTETKVIPGHYRLSIPWVVYVIFYRKYGTSSIHSGLHVAFRNKKLSDKDQILCYPHFYNVYAQTLRICLGREQMNAKTPEDLFREVITEFWNGTFTQSGSLHQSYVQNNCYSHDKRITASPDGSPDWKLWQKSTLKDEDFAVKVDWTGCCELYSLLEKHRVAYGSR